MFFVRRAVTLNSVRRHLLLKSFIVAVCLASRPLPFPAQPVPALVSTALANELGAAQDQRQPMRFLLRKSSPRYTSTRQIYETRDGNVSLLLNANGQPLSAADQAKEHDRLAQILADPSRQRRRKQGEGADRDRALRILRVMPAAFLYSDEGPAQAATGTVERFTFRPNPGFEPPSLETQVLAGISGEIWIDPTAQRVVRLEGRLDRDIDFGWGILGRLYKGGWIRLEQADIGAGQWRAVRFEMKMSARVVWRTRVFDTVEEISQYAALPPSIGYREAIAALEGKQIPGRQP